MSTSTVPPLHRRRRQRVSTPVDGDSLTLTDWALPEQPAMIWFNAVYFGTKPLERVDR